MENTMKADLKEIGCKSTDWINSGSRQSPVVGFCKHGNEPLGCIKVGNFLTSWATIKFSRTLLHGISYKSVHTMFRSVCMHKWIM